MIPHRNFQTQLQNFGHEAKVAAQYLYAEMAIQHAASKSKKLLNRLNNSPMFWLACGASLQSAAYISLGRMFDVNSKYNVNALLDSMEASLHIFQREALAVRKQAGAKLDPKQLQTYLDRAYFPTVADVTRLRKMLAKYRAIYDRVIRPARNKYLAHREKQGQLEIEALFASGTVQELWRLATFLLQLEKILWEQLNNGRKPLFRSSRHSVKSMYDAPRQGNKAHELMVADVKRLMKFMESAELGRLPTSDRSGEEKE
jgi:hypothetical protein